jgi:[ribosomal protein S5]-alanine N-acetyltransferase
MSELRINVRDGFYLSAINGNDKPALLEHLHTRDVYETTINIPHPYTGPDADWWIRKRIEQARRQGKETTFALRTAGKLIGVLGADNIEIGMSHRAEIGYWLARAFWGHGLMSAAVQAYVRYAFAELEVVRLTAHVFESNLASARVLEKNGFTLEGRLRKHLMKEGRLIDARFYGLLKADLQ